MKKYNVSFNTAQMSGLQVAEIVRTANDMDESVRFWGKQSLLHVSTDNIYLCRVLRDFKMLFNA